MATSTSSSINQPPDTNQGPLALGILISLVSIAFIHILVRLQTRIFLSKAVGWDDFFAAASMVLSIVQMGLTIKSVHNGYRRHVRYIPSEQIGIALKYIIISEPIDVLAVGLQKISIAIALIRLNLGPMYKTIVWSATIPNTTACLTAVIVLYARCRPYQKSWEFESQESFCWSGESLVIFFRVKSQQESDAPS